VVKIHRESCVTSRTTRCFISTSSAPDGWSTRARWLTICRASCGSSRLLKKSYMSNALSIVEGCAQSSHRDWSNGVMEWWSDGSRPILQYSITPTLHLFARLASEIFLSSLGRCHFEPFEKLRINFGRNHSLRSVHLGAIQYRATGGRPIQRRKFSGSVQRRIIRTKS
jgi:hypothetical protein